MTTTIKKILTLMFDFVRGVHLWPLVNLIAIVGNDGGVPGVLADFHGTELHLITAVLVLVESLWSFLRKESESTFYELSRGSRKM